MLTLTVTGQALKVTTPVIAADTINYLTAQFAFTHDWDGLIKIARFSNDENSAEVQLTNDCIREEDGLNLTEGRWYVSVIGEEIVGGQPVQRITTVRAFFTVLPSGVEDGEPLPSLPSYGEQILAEVEDINEKLGAFTAEAETLAPEPDGGAE